MRVKHNQDMVFSIFHPQNIKALCIEIKAVEKTLPVREAQLVTYLKLSDKKLGLLLNFNADLLKNGIRRKINGYLNEKGHIY